jgi:predicted amidohydrolase
LSLPEAQTVAERIPGPQSERLVQICQELKATIMVGLLEKDEQGRVFNTALIAGPEGILGTYRKTHLPFLGVDRFLTSGNALHPPLETPVGRVGMLICYDLRFPEPCRALALMGAQIVLLSTAWPSAATLYPEFVAQTRAAENGIFLVAANRIGEERRASYLGHSRIIGPDGEVLAQAGGDEETILYADIDPSRSDRKKRVFLAGEYELDLFNDRRPDLYGRISA